MGTERFEMSFERSDAFEELYQGAETPPWVTGEPQPVVVELAERGRFTGRVLDVGCGPGDNSLYLAARGLDVLGVDGAPTPVEQARAKARERGVAAEFQVADAFALTALGRTFDTALDSAFLHIPGNTEERRRAYTEQLAAVLVPGGWAHLLELSEERDDAPSLTREQLLAAFDPASWTDGELSEVTCAGGDGEHPAWLYSVRRR